MLKRIETLQRHKVRRLHVRSKFWVAIESLSAADHLPGLLKVLRFDHEHSLGNARGLRLEADSEYRCLLLADRSLGRIDREAQAGIGSEGCAKVGKAHVFVLDLKVRARVAKVWIEKSKMNGERKKFRMRSCVGYQAVNPKAMKNWKTYILQRERCDERSTYGDL